MAELKIDSVTTSNMRTTVTDYTVDTKSTDGATGQDETSYQNPYWTKWYGYYKNVPEVKIVMDTRAIWTIGDGFMSDPETTAILDNIYGTGIDTFDSILENIVITKRLCGDAFVEIIRDPETKKLVNLKVLDPSSVKIIADKYGIIKRYEQTVKLPHGQREIIKYQPEELLHFCNKRVADEIHGTPDLESFEKIILALGESFDDFKTVVHRNVVPLRVVEVDIDDEDKIGALATKYENMIKNKEVLFVPKDTVKVETQGLSANGTFNPLPWREHLKQYFYQVCGIPQIILGSANDYTESSAKIAYLSFEQNVKAEQREIIMQIWNQLQLRIDLAFPASLKNEMLSDESKDSTGSFKPSDTTAGAGA